jgi:predicted dinucleotide-binding enzyme
MKLLGSLLLAAVLAAPASAADPGDCIAVIGTGSVGGALGPRFAGLGERIVYGSRTPDAERVQDLVRRTGVNAAAATAAAATRDCSTIVLAVPWYAVDTTMRSLGDLKGKLIIDVTNPLGVRDGVEFAYEVPGSGGEVVQSLAAGASVVKAFNTLNYRVMAHPPVAGGPVSVLIAGDDAAAKAEVSALAAGIGLEPIDVGPLRVARYTEAMALLYVHRLISGQPPFEFHLRTWPGR